MLEATELAAVRGERAVFAGLSFRLAPGGALLLAGRNGAGKSTLLRVLAGLLRPADGRVLWNGADALADRAEHAARLAWVSAQDAIKPGLTVAETLGFEADFVDGRADAGLAAFALEDLAEVPVRMLSTGQRRRLALARLALAPRALWLLDEPTLGLDAASVARFGALAAAHRAAGGMVVAATHLPLPLPGATELALA